MTIQNYKIEIRVPREVARANGRTVSRDDFFAWAWQQLSAFQLEGIVEGYQEAKDVSDQEPILDPAQAPSTRDWVGAHQDQVSEFYFKEVSGAQEAILEIGKFFDLDLKQVRPIAIEQKDWNEEWQKSFAGLVVEPDWWVRPPWDEKSFPAGYQELIINPGSGFGTGTHPTTQLCLAEISVWWKENGEPSDSRVLDFGSGSGILSTAVAKLGVGQVDAVEIDPLANENARDNLELNFIGPDVVRIQTHLSQPAQQYLLVIANILKPTLLEFCERLIERILPGGRLILSGLLEGDVPDILESYKRQISRDSRLQLTSEPRITQRDEWYCLVFSF